MNIIRCFAALSFLFFVYSYEGLPADSQEVGPYKNNQVSSVEEDEVVLTATVPKSSKADEKTILLIEIKNTGKRAIDSTIYVERCISIGIKSQAGADVPKTLFKTRLEQPTTGNGSNINIRLGQGRKAQVPFDLGLLYDITTGGEYKATIEFVFFREKEIKGKPNPPDKISWEPKRITLKDVPFVVYPCTLPILEVVKDKKP